MTTPIRPSEATLIEVRQALQRLEMNRRKGIQNNYTATTDPGSSDDETSGYSAGSFWFNTNEDTLWLCTDATTDAADWVNFFGTGEVAGTGHHYGSFFPPAGESEQLTASVKGDTVILAVSGGMTIVGTPGTDTLTFTGGMKKAVFIPTGDGGSGTAFS
jgi:hypothetical protein